MRGLFSIKDYTSIPALALPNIGVDILKAEQTELWKQPSNLPLRRPASAASTKARGNRSTTKKRSSSHVVFSAKQRAKRASTMTNSGSGTKDFPNIPIALTHADVDTLTWMLNMLREIPEPCVCKYHAKFIELLRLFNISASPQPGPCVLVKDLLHNGFLFGKMVENLERTTLSGLTDQQSPVVAYNNWSKALSILRNDVRIEPTNLFIERDLSRAGHDFIRIFLPLLNDLRKVYGKSTDIVAPRRMAKDQVDTTIEQDLTPLDVNTTASDGVTSAHVACTNLKKESPKRQTSLTYVPRSRILQQMRADVSVAYPIEQEHCQQEVARWLEWLSLTPPTLCGNDTSSSFVCDDLVANPWCNGKSFHLLLSRIYAVLVDDNVPLILPVPIPETRDHCIQNNNFILRFAEHCGISSAYSILADDFLKPSRCYTTVWALLNSIVQRFPLCETLNFTKGGAMGPFACMQYDPLQFSMVEKSIAHWIFTLGFLNNKPYHLTNIPTFDVLIPHIKSRKLFVDLALMALRLDIFEYVPKKISYNSLQYIDRSGENRSVKSPGSRWKEKEQNIDLGLQLFLEQEDIGKAVHAIGSSSGQIPRLISEMTKFQLILLMEDIHRCWDKAPSRLIKPEPYAPYAPLSFKVEQINMELLSSSASERGPGGSTATLGAEIIAENDSWKMEAPFVRPPDEILIGTHEIVPNIWFLPEIRGYPMNYDCEYEIIPLFMPSSKCVEPY